MSNRRTTLGFELEKIHKLKNDPIFKEIMNNKSTQFFHQYKDNLIAFINYLDLFMLQMKNDISLETGKLIKKDTDMQNLMTQLNNKIRIYNWIR